MLKLNLDIIQKVKPKNFCISLKDCMYIFQKKLCPFCGEKCKVDDMNDENEENYKLVCTNCNTRFSFFCSGWGYDYGSNHFVTTEEMLEE